jgi:hypothetical protein
LANTININDVSGCVIVCRPVRTSVVLENCRECRLAIACQQLRVHSTTQSDLYVHTTTLPIIEDSTNVRFAEYPIRYEGLTSDLVAQGLSPNISLPHSVHDFNWLSNSQPSPNWSFLIDNDAKLDWPL